MIQRCAQESNSIQKSIQIKDNCTKDLLNVRKVKITTHINKNEISKNTKLNSTAIPMSTIGTYSKKKMNEKLTLLSNDTESIKPDIYLAIQNASLNTKVKLIEKFKANSRNYEKSEESLNIIMDKNIINKNENISNSNKNKFDHPTQLTYTPTPKTNNKKRRFFLCFAI